MKTIFKYLSGRSECIVPVYKIYSSFAGTYFKRAAIIILLIFMVYTAGAQRKHTRGTADSMFYAFFGVSQLNFQRQAFDQWTRANFKLTEPKRPALYIDLGAIMHQYDIGVAINRNGTMQTSVGYLGRRLTGYNSPIGSWLNIELGEVISRPDNLTPATYMPVPPGQQMELNYSAFYIAITSKNYFNFFHYTAKLGRARIPVNSGFFATVGWQPGARNWNYGYYDQDSVFHTQRIKPIIPKFGKFQATGGVFMGF